MADTYKGESPGKKRARLGFWLSVKDTQGSNFYEKKHLVLASREGGDISVLLGLGVDPCNIIAVERNEEAAEACAEKWPRVDVHLGDAVHILSQFVQQDPKCVQTVFLDFCGPITRETLIACSEAFKLLYPGPSQVFAAAFLKGRERRQRPIASRILIGNGWANRRRRRARIAAAESGWARQLLRTLDAQVDADPMPIMHQMANVAGLKDPGEMRLMFLSCVLDETSLHRRSEPLFCINYFGAGVPMCITALAVRRRATTGTVDRNPHVIFVGDPDSAAGREFRSNFGSDRAEMEEKPENWVKRFCVDEPDASYSSLVLNISRSTIAAWKAHATRGTYNRSAAE